MSDLDWDDLRYFLAAARAKTLAGAARALGVEHTTVGRRLTALERAIGGPLVLRGADGLRLTELGERLVPRAEELERTVDVIRELARSQATRVRLAIPSGLTRFFTADLARLQREHAGVALEILSGAGVVDLSSGEADLALRSSPITDPELVARKLCNAGFSLYASDSYLTRHGAPRDSEDLAGHELIGFHEHLAHTPAAQWLGARSTGASVVLRSREVSDMLTAAVDGVGLAVLPCSLADAEPRLRRLTREVVASRPLVLVHRREARLAKEVRVVIRFVVEVITRNASQIEGLGVVSSSASQGAPGHSE